MQFYFSIDDNIRILLYKFLGGRNRFISFGMGELRSRKYIRSMTLFNRSLVVVSLTNQIKFYFIWLPFIPELCHFTVNLTIRPKFTAVDLETRFNNGELKLPMIAKLCRIFVISVEWNGIKVLLQPV